MGKHLERSSDCSPVSVGGWANSVQHSWLPDLCSPLLSSQIGANLNCSVNHSSTEILSTKLNKEEIILAGIHIKYMSRAKRVSSWELGWLNWNHSSVAHPLFPIEWNRDLIYDLELGPRKRRCFLRWPCPHQNLHYHICMSEWPVCFLKFILIRNG